MASVSSPKPSPAKVVDFTYLEQGKAKENLERLAHAKFSIAPLTSCMTREIHQKVPLYKPTPERIRNWSYGFGFFTTLTGIAIRTFGEMMVCASGENWQTNFFPVASQCFVRAIHKMNAPGVRATTFYNISWAGVSGLTAYVVGRIFLRDTKENERFSLLNNEYSAIAESLIQSFVTANDETAIRAIRCDAEKLKANLPVIKAYLMKGARLEPDKIELLVQKLTLAANRVLNGELQSFETASRELQIEGKRKNNQPAVKFHFFKGVQERLGPETSKSVVQRVSSAANDIANRGVL